MTTNRVRWECPNGKHPGALASTRPPKDSLVRYCLPCSQETGRLVERVAPALERKRAAAAVTSAAKAKAKRARETTARQRKKEADNQRYIVEGVDLRDEMKKMIKLRAFGGKTGRLVRWPPELVISRRSKHPLSRMGYAEPWRNRITVATWPSHHLSDARETLLHELTHIVVGGHPGGGSKTVWHGPQFRIMLNRARKEYASKRQAA